MSGKKVIVKLRDGKNSQTYNPFLFLPNKKAGIEKNIGHPFKIEGIESLYVGIITDLEDEVEISLNGLFSFDKNWKYPFEYIIPHDQIGKRTYLEIKIMDKKAEEYLIRIPIESQRIYAEQAAA